MQRAATRNKWEAWLRRVMLVSPLGFRGFEVDRSNGRSLGSLRLQMQPGEPRQIEQDVARAAVGQKPHGELRRRRRNRKERAFSQLRIGRHRDRNRVSALGKMAVDQHLILLVAMVTLDDVGRAADQTDRY